MSNYSSQSVLGATSVESHKDGNPETADDPPDMVASPLMLNDSS